MNVLMLGDISGNLDEGMKNTTSHLHREISRNHDVMVLHPRRAVWPSTVREIRKFQPNVIHYLHGPSLLSLIVIRWLSIWTSGARTVISATQPDLPQRSN